MAVKSDGTVAASPTSINGLLDLAERRLIADPKAHLRGLAKDPSIFGL